MCSKEAPRRPLEACPDSFPLRTLLVRNGKRVAQEQPGPERTPPDRSFALCMQKSALEPYLPGSSTTSK